MIIWAMTSSVTIVNILEYYWNYLQLHGNLLLAVLNLAGANNILEITS